MRIGLLAIIAALAPAATAEAASITQLPGARGCLHDVPRDGCVNSRATDFSESAVVSPDGRHVYVTGGSNDFGALTTYARDRATGALRQLPGKAGCTTSNGDVDEGTALAQFCTRAGRISSLNAIVISPNGRTVYTSSGSPQEHRQVIAVFRRDPASGRLTQLQCLTPQADVEGCAQGAFQTPLGLALARDGRTLYAGGESLSTFPIAEDGDIAGPGACTLLLGNETRAGGLCAGVRVDATRRQITHLLLSPDGRRLYAGAGGDADDGSQVQAYDLDAANPAAAPRPAECAGVPGCPRARGLNDLEDLAVAPDGGAVYTASARFTVTDDIGLEGYTASAIGIFAAPSLRQLPGRRGCVEAGAERGAVPATCAPGRELLSAEAIEVTPSGRHVVAAFGDSAKVVLYARNRETHALRRVAGARGCVEQQPLTTTLCTAGRGIHGTRDIAISPDGRNAYVVTFPGVTVFRLR